MPKVNENPGLLADLLEPGSSAGAIGSNKSLPASRGTAHPLRIGFVHDPPGRSLMT